MDAQAKVRALYGVMQSLENKLGGGEGVEGLYGSVNKGGMQKIINALRNKCSLDGDSRLVDIGAGLGRPLMHALVEPGIASAFGVEIDRIKCDKAAAFLKQAVLEMQRRGISTAQLEAPAIQCAPIEQIKTLDPCTHAYSFWEGVPLEGKAAFGRLFAGSRSLRAVAVVQRAMRGKAPAEVMEELGFGKLQLVDSFSVSMSGSGRSFTAYVFNRADTPAPLPAPLVAEQSVAEGVATPQRSYELLDAAQCASVECSIAVLAAEAASRASVQQELPGELEDSAAAAGASAEVVPLLTELGQGREGEAAQQPALGRGARRAARDRRAAAVAVADLAVPAPTLSARSAPRWNTRAAAGSAGAASGVQAAPASAGKASKRGSPQKAASPQKPKGVQKKQSPRKQPPVLLQDVRVRRSGAVVAAPAGVGKTKASGKDAGSADEAAVGQSPPRVRRGLLA